ncbi:MAG: UDP-2,4-diacetamido-2,4,6-trideoxy-beta-L-altropyranose hydrolase [Chthoniobacterales bacterium]
MKSLLIRADASREIGTGHVMRCLAMAQAWKDRGGFAHFACAELPDTLRRRLAEESFTVHSLTTQCGTTADAEVTSRLAREVGAEWIVVDGYCFNRAFQSVLHASGRKVLVLDDNGETGPWGCDAILNQNTHASTIDYGDRLDGCTLLRGSRYALLRREFQPALRDHFPARDQADGLRLLILMGGSDAENITCQLLSILKKLQSGIHSARVICGGANSHLAELETSASALGFPCEVICNVSDMTPHFRWANAALTAAGSTCWELCAFRVPFLPFAIVPNQNAIARSFGGIPWESETAAAAVTDWIKKMKSSMFEISIPDVDAKGADRVCSFLQSVASFSDVDGNRYDLRLADEQDAELLFEWANDPTVRKQSFQTESITWQTHCTWMASGDPGRTIYICERESEPVGSVRFESVSGNEALANIQMGADWRGKRLAAPLISAASQMYSSQHANCTIVAKIKPDNSASSRAFEKAGYTISKTTSDPLNLTYIYTDAIV